MRLTILFSYFILVVLFISCKERIASIPNQSIFLFKDNDGLYLYNPKTEKEKIILKLEKDEIFLDEPCKIINDTLIVGLKEKKYIHEGFIKNYFSLDLKSGKKWLSQKLIYQKYYKEEYKLNIKTISFDLNGDTTDISDMTMPWQSTEGSWKGKVFNDLHPRFYSEQVLGDKKIFSLQGSLYLCRSLDTILILEFKGKYDPKFGCGYLQPEIDPSGKYAIYRFAPEFWDIFHSSSLRRIELDTKNTEKLKAGEFISPTFSSDGKFILFYRNYKENKLKIWSNDIYILDVLTLSEKKISNAYSAQWK